VSVFYEVLIVICLTTCAFAVDISSFYIQEQKDLHGSNMVQGSKLLSCKCLSCVLLECFGLEN